MESAKSSIEQLIRDSVEAFKRMAPEEQAAMMRQQRRSFVIGEAGFGSDADEAAYRLALENNDKAELKRLSDAAELRRRIAEKWLDDNGY